MIRLRPASFVASSACCAEATSSSSSQFESSAGVAVATPALAVKTPLPGALGLGKARLPTGLQLRRDTQRAVAIGVAQNDPELLTTRLHAWCYDATVPTSGPRPGDRPDALEVSSR